MTPRSRISNLTAQLRAPEEIAQYVIRLREALDVLSKTDTPRRDLLAHRSNVSISKACRQEESSIVRSSAFKIISKKLWERGEPQPDLPDTHTKGHKEPQ